MEYLLVLSFLLVSLVGIVYSAIIFTNGIEHIGEKFGISGGATGSIFAAIATALPETLVPIVAVIGVANQLPSDMLQTADYNIAMGAMLGAPLMLSSLTIFMMAGFAWIIRGKNAKITPFKKFALRDIATMIAGILLVMCLAITQNRDVEYTIGFLLFIIYIYYLYKTLIDDADDEDESLDKLYISKYFKDSKTTAAIQSALAIIGIIVFSKLMVFGIEDLADILTNNIHSTADKIIFIFVLATVLAPIATELPEKINSIIWIKKGKDGLAVGNITGALAFQSTVIPGILAFIVPINISLFNINGISVIITLISSITLFTLIYKEKLTSFSGTMFVIPYLTFLTLSFIVK